MWWKCRFWFKRSEPDLCISNKLPGDVVEIDNGSAGLKKEPEEETEVSSGDIHYVKAPVRLLLLRRQQTLTMTLSRPIHTGQDPAHFLPWCHRPWAHPSYKQGRTQLTTCYVLRSLDIPQYPGDQGGVTEGLPEKVPLLQLEGTWQWIEKWPSLSCCCTAGKKLSSSQ